MLLASDFAVGQVLWSLFWFFLFVIWIVILFRVFTDIFRSKDLGGFAKFLWTFFVIVMPYLGVFVYLIARGDKMTLNQVRAAQAQQESLNAYVRDAAGATASPAAELERLAELKAQGVITDEEFATLKAKAING